MAKKVAIATEQGPVFIDEPKFKVVHLMIRGTAPFVQLRFSEKQKKKLREEHAISETDKTKRKVREPKNYEELFQEAMYKTEKGEKGINALSFKRALVAACRTTDRLSMKQAKMIMHIQADGYDETEGLPLVFFMKGTPHAVENMCRNANGNSDLRVRAMWDKGWEAVVRLSYDSDIIDSKSVTNLMIRAGSQVGIGEGRPDSTKSDGAGMGWGTFEVVGVEEV
jgi:hypothetical protein